MDTTTPINVNQQKELSILKEELDKLDYSLALKNEIKSELKKEIFDELKLKQNSTSDNKKNTTEITNHQIWWSNQNAMTMCSMILFFGLIVILVIGNLLKLGKNSEDILRTIGTVLIIVFGVFAIVAGYDEKQVMPIVGLLGTIAGYLLAKETKPDVNKEKKED